MEKRYQLYCDMIDVLDEAYELMEAYDAIPHNYGSATLYQAESQIIHQVGKNQGITASELAVILKKTTSACSQLVKKLRKKGWIMQTRNENNNREYYLNLTEEGQKIYEDHAKFEEACYMRSFHGLEDFTEEDFKTYIAIQKKLNESFALDLKESREAADAAGREAPEA